MSQTTRESPTLERHNPDSGPPDAFPMLRGSVSPANSQPSHNASPGSGVVSDVHRSSASANSAFNRSRTAAVSASAASSRASSSAGSP